MIIIEPILCNSNKTHYGYNHIPAVYFSPRRDGLYYCDACRRYMQLYFSMFKREDFIGLDDNY